MHRITIGDRRGSPSHLGTGAMRHDRARSVRAIAPRCRGTTAGRTARTGYATPMKKLLFAMAIGAALAWLSIPSRLAAP